MKIEGPGSFRAPSYLFVVVVALALSSALKAQALAEDDSPAEPNRRIEELYKQGNIKRGFSWLSKLAAG